MHGRALVHGIAIAAFLVSNPAGAQNIVPDPAFTTGVAAWSPFGVTGNYTMTFVPGISKRPGSGSALLSSIAAGGTYFVCLDVVSGRTYDEGYSLLFPDAGRLIGFSDVFVAFDGPGCTGTGNGGLVTLIPPQTGAWTDFTIRRGLSASTKSVQIGIAAIGLPGTQPAAYLDDVYFGLVGTVPPIDPPAPIPALAPWGLAALGGALALASGRALRG